MIRNLIKKYFALVTESKEYLVRYNSFFKINISSILSGEPKSLTILFQAKWYKVQNIEYEQENNLKLHYQSLEKEGIKDQLFEIDSICLLGRSTFWQKLI